MSLVGCSSWVARAFVPLAYVALGAGCGGALPKRYVVEHDLGAHAFRRYQHVLDVEFPVEGNPAEGHTATYVHRTEADPPANGEVPFTTAFITVYTRSKGLAAELKARMESLGTYEVKVRELAGAYVWWLDGGEDRWAVWVSGKHIVKLGAPPGAKRIPEDVLEAYLSLYPSELNRWGRAEAGAPSAGPRAAEPATNEAADGADGLPKHLREGAPR